MRQLIKSSIIFLCLSSACQLAFAGPWFTGPLLAPAGHTIPRGHTNFEIYALDVRANGRYNQSGQIIHTPLFTSFIGNPILTHGFTDWLDVQLVVPYTFNSTRGQHFDRITDVTTSFGFQLIEQKGSPQKADVRILLQQVFPTGKYDQLDPLLLGTDSTGLGSYQTQIGLNLQYLIELFPTHYLRGRLILSHLYASAVSVHGFNSYGGTGHTSGRIRPGGENDLDWALEYTLTQNWVAVMEGTVSKGKETLFNGILDIGDIGGPSSNIGNKSYFQQSLAPAIEYNFSPNVGIIGGVWFPIEGQNSSHFMTYVLALNAYW